MRTQNTFSLVVGVTLNPHFVLMLQIVYAVITLCNKKTKKEYFK